MWKIYWKLRESTSVSSVVIPTWSCNQSIFLKAIRMYMVAVFLATGNSALWSVTKKSVSAGRFDNKLGYRSNPLPYPFLIYQHPLFSSVQFDFSDFFRQRTLLKCIRLSRMANDHPWQTLCEKFCDRRTQKFYECPMEEFAQWVGWSRRQRSPVS